MSRHFCLLAGLLASTGAAAQTPPAPASSPAPSPAAAPVSPPADLPVRLSARAQARLRAVAVANRGATREPDARGFVNATQVYPWSDGALYRLYAAPERVSEIALEPGEKLISIAAGDTARWTIGDTTSGAGEGRRTHILLKPVAAGLRTNLIVTTDRRTYHIALESTRSTAMLALSWTYQASQLIALRRESAGAGPVAPPNPGPALERLDFGYAIRGDRPAWRPLRVFDDGQQTYVEFPPGTAHGEVPPLFVLGDKDEPQLVNYRQRGRFYIVDRLFEAAELRLGMKKQKIVRIVRTGTHRSHRGNL